MNFEKKARKNSKISWKLSTLLNGAGESILRVNPSFWKCSCVLKDVIFCLPKELSLTTIIRSINFLALVQDDNATLLESLFFVRQTICVHFLRKNFNFLRKFACIS